MTQAKDDPIGATPIEFGALSASALAGVITIAVASGPYTPLEGLVSLPLLVCAFAFGRPKTIRPNQLFGFAAVVGLIALPFSAYVLEWMTWGFYFQTDRLELCIQKRSYAEALSISCPENSEDMLGASRFREWWLVSVWAAIVALVLLFRNSLFEVVSQSPEKALETESSAVPASDPSHPQTTPPAAP